ncbi:hypothetical protein HYC85_016869 [Camellia sinensis]|uniref:Uncharacterized protein n=1 Tax=Camellia sinensis TaxID=4442 RepID=A0A7J7H312_CAMSI|nr:hypothetical protein HYC85_016869 [Camellia sinensis]
MAEEFGNKSSLTEDKDFGYNNRNHHSARNKMQEIETKNGDKGNRKKPNSFEPGSEDPKPKAKSKKVRFSGEGKNEDEKLVQGKRFSPEEDEIIKDAVSNYIRYNDLGEDDLAMVRGNYWLWCRRDMQVTLEKDINQGLVLLGQSVDAVGEFCEIWRWVVWRVDDYRVPSDDNEYNCHFKMEFPTDGAN